MIDSGSKLRKAAILVHSLDADTAACLLAQLSPAEATAVRQAVAALGPTNRDEQTDVLSEFRRARPLAAEPSARGVELSLSEPLGDLPPDDARPSAANGERFDFLLQAPTDVLAQYLGREHSQTIAVVLAHLPPERAAAVLDALPENRQADTCERLALLGETDPESVAVVARELAAWVTERLGRRSQRQRGHGTLAAILAAANPASRDQLFANIQAHDQVLADDLAPLWQRSRPQKPAPPAYGRPLAASHRPVGPPRSAAGIEPPRSSTLSGPAPPPPFEFDDLIHLDGPLLATVLRSLDASVLALALAGSRDELVDRICDQMPKSSARDFRRGLRRLGPTRLSDVETAQRTVASVAAQQLAERRRARAAYMPTGQPNDNRR